MIDGKNFFDQPIQSYVKAYENIQKITTGQGDDYTTGCLPDYNYFKKHCKMIAIDLSKQQATIFIIEETKETILDFSQGTVKNLLYCEKSMLLYNLACVAKVFNCTLCSTILFCFNIISNS